MAKISVRRNGHELVCYLHPAIMPNLSSRPASHNKLFDEACRIPRRKCYNIGFGIPPARGRTWVVKNRQACFSGFVYWWLYSEYVGRVATDSHPNEFWLVSRPLLPDDRLNLNTTFNTNWRWFLKGRSEPEFGIDQSRQILTLFSKEPDSADLISPASSLV